MTPSAASTLKNDFHQFVREEFGASLTARGYRRKAGSFEKSDHGVRAIALFFRYHDRLRPMFNVRLQIALADFTAELGVVLMNDLSAMIDRGSHIEEWRWPLEGDDRRRVSREISEALGSKGLPWLEACLDPSQLAARLESEKRFNSDTDEERASIMAALGAA